MTAIVEGGGRLILTFCWKQTTYAISTQPQPLGHADFSIGSPKNRAASPNHLFGSRKISAGPPTSPGLACWGGLGHPRFFLGHPISFSAEGHSLFWLWLVASS